MAPGAEEVVAEEVDLLAVGRVVSCLPPKKKTRKQERGVSLKRKVSVMQWNLRIWHGVGQIS